MVKKQKSNIPFKNIVIVIIVLAFISILLIVLASKQKKVVNTEQETTTYGQTVYVTPTIIPAEIEGKKIFYHPQNHFSFKYPNEWYIELSKLNVNNPLYYVFLSEKKEKPAFRIHFMTGGRDYPNYREEVSYKLLGDKNITWTTLYNNENKAVEAFANFPDNNFDNNLTSIYIYLPENNQEEFIKQVEDIIATIK